MTRRKRKPVATLPSVPKALDRDSVLAAMRAAKGHQPTAAEGLEVSLSTLQRRLNALGLRDELAALAESEGWPDKAARAREARWGSDGEEVGSSEPGRKR